MSTGFAKYIAGRPIKKDGRAIHTYARRYPCGRRGQNRKNGATVGATAEGQKGAKRVKRAVRPIFKKACKIK
ncbi:hypothetical protein LI291_06660 [Intestinibacillus massiliensis]|nr:hypothetical protein [Intestinibacillus massiliensis]